MCWFRKKQGRIPEAVIHIGVEKTGTSTIQEFLNQNRSLLAKNGVGFPIVLGLRNHRALAACCTPVERTDDFFRMHHLNTPADREKWQKAYVKKFHRMIGRTSNRFSKVVISSEHFSSRLVNSKSVNNLRELLLSHFHKLSVVVYLRRQDALFTSLYTTSCRAGRVSDQVLPDRVPPHHYANYLQLLDRWAAVFGRENIRPRLFEAQAFHNHNLLDDFIQSAGLPNLPEYLIPENKNLSYSRDAQNAAQLFNRHFAKSGISAEDPAVRALRHELMDRVQKVSPGKGFMPTRAQAVAFYQGFEKDNNQLAREWFGVPDLFSDDFSAYPETALREQPNDEIIAMVLSAIAAYHDKHQGPR